jgi:hypothetical protein
VLFIFLIDAVYVPFVLLVLLTHQQQFDLCTLFNRLLFNVPVKLLENYKITNKIIFGEKNLKFNKTSYSYFFCFCSSFFY